jgi:hypothetical protein
MCYDSTLEKKGSWIGYQAEFADKPFFPTWDNGNFGNDCVSIR